MAQSTIADLIRYGLREAYIRSNSKANRPSRLEVDELVTIAVGQEGTEKPPKEYRIQRTLLINASEWFDKALRNDWKEGQDRKLSFPGTDPQVVEVFLYYLICGVKPFDIDDIDDGTPGCQRLAVRIWIFGDEHFLPKLQNHAMEQLYSHFGNYGEGSSSLEVETMRETFEGCAIDSHLYTFMYHKLNTGLQERVKYDISMASTPDRQKLSKPGGLDIKDVELLEGCPGLFKKLARVVVRLMSTPNCEYIVRPLEDYLVPGGQSLALVSKSAVTGNR